MELEHKVETLTIDTGFEAKLKDLEAQGWTLIPGVLPVAIYHLVRLKQGQTPAAGVGGFGKLAIDESKILVIPGSATKQ